MFRVAGVFRKQPRHMLLALLILVLGVIGFFTDLVEDLSEVQQELSEGYWAAIWSLIWLSMMTVALATAIFVLFREVVRRQTEVSDFDRQVTLMQGEFQFVLERLFDEWALTPAERDIALLILKGLNSNEIARARRTASGTIRAQTSSVFRKVGVSSRAELMSLFLDAFLVSDVPSGREAQKVR